MAALPYESTTLRWLVPCSGTGGATAVGAPKSPGLALPMLCCGEISAARAAK
ncbi:Uncharacterised protein [Mycobacterium tuberculosis]|uniref:Uncharacterized protein n=1 Tax=Mycobacterium tuberculosis TaxID=1773 RepID=A0A0U0T8M8_MYCTX|nr:Uncharacterised protein [Mycobacterium tuberculosis]COX29266.1 Uncharacterised protein [Mycobacterium tuberculosis]COZ64084.1 Uncharacterised protein [Mycobacterium tuberculosis]COZ65627.1 Uncharacterised protein [Mycobacterium tuberculosis]